MLATALAVALLPAAAGAHGPATAVHHADDPYFGFTPEQARGMEAEPLPHAPAPGPWRAKTAPPAVVPATTWCGTERTTDDVEHARTTLPGYKVLYVHAADKPSRLTTYAQRIQRSVVRVSTKFDDDPVRPLGVRFDFGTDCGPQYVDVMTVRLPRAAAAYDTGNADADLELLYDDVVAAVRATGGLDAEGLWDFLVYADVDNGLYGQARWFDSFDASGPDAAAHPTAGPDGMAVLWAKAFTGSIQEGYTAFAATHEVTHTLGAVQRDAPFATLGHHCRVVTSIMCYDDGTLGGQPLVTRCNVAPAVPNTVVQFDAIPLDCERSIFFHARSDDVSGYLADHHNVARSVAVCEAATCMASTIRPRAAAAVADGPRVAGSPVRFDASGSTDRDGELRRFHWDLGGDGTVDRTTDGPVLELAPARSGSFGGGRVTVEDDSGLTATASFPAVQVAGRPPAVALAAPAPQPSGRQVVLDASGTVDPDDGGRVVRYRFTLGDGSVVESAAPRATWTPERPGRFRVAVLATDDEGLTAQATAELEVLNRAPTVRASADASRVGPGSTVTLRAVADDPDGTVREVAWDLDGNGSFETAGAEVARRLPATGRKTFRVRATDDQGATAQASVAVVVAAGAKVVRPSALRSVTRTRAGRLTVRVACASPSAACRLRVTAGGARRDVAVRKAQVRSVTLTLPRAVRRKPVRVEVRVRSSKRLLAAKRVAAPRA